MKPCIPFIFFLLISASAYPQQTSFTAVKINAATSVKDQLSSGACWDFACASMIESELLEKRNTNLDLSETFIMYYTYIDKATKYLDSHGRTMFSPGGIGEDMLNTIDLYGAMPEDVYPGTDGDTIISREDEMFPTLQAYVDSIIETGTGVITANWKPGFEKILRHYLGTPCDTFIYRDKLYTPKTFASAFLKTSSSDFIGLTSFTHHPYYAPFMIEVSHNYNNNLYNNLPLGEFISTVKSCIENGYTLIWDTDITNDGFQRYKGFAMWANGKKDPNIFPDGEEKPYNEEIRQELFTKKVTQNNHLMQITGLVKDGNGKEYFVVKNSWGNIGPFHGYLYVSIPYFAINTISVLVNKKALPRDVANKINDNNKLQQTQAMNKFATPGYESSMTTTGLPNEEGR